MAYTFDDFTRDYVREHLDWLTPTYPAPSVGLAQPHPT